MTLRATPKNDNHRLGLIFTLGGALVFAPDGLMLRVIALDGLSLTVWRGLLSGTLLMAGCLLVHRSALWALLRGASIAGVLIILLQGGALVCFHLAIERTSVANVLVCFALSPTIAALLASVFLKERLPLPTWLAIAAAAIGMLIIARGASTDGSSLLGLGFAFLNATLIAGFYVAVRHLKAQSAIPFVGLGFFAAGLVAWLVAPLPPMESLQWGVLMVNALVLLPLAIILLSLGPRHLPAPEVAMLTLLQAVLGPLIVWWALDEDPGLLTVIGGGAIVATVLAHSTYRLMRQRYKS